MGRPDATLEASTPDIFLEIVDRGVVEEEVLDPVAAAPAGAVGSIKDFRRRLSSTQEEAQVEARARLAQQKEAHFRRRLAQSLDYSGQAPTNGTCSSAVESRILGCVHVGRAGRAALLHARCAAPGAPAVPRRLPPPPPSSPLQLHLQHQVAVQAETRGQGHQQPAHLGARWRPALGRLWRRRRISATRQRCRLALCLDCIPLPSRAPLLQIEMYPVYASAAVLFVCLVVFIAMYISGTLEEALA